MAIKKRMPTHSAQRGTMGPGLRDRFFHLLLTSFEIFQMPPVP